MNRDWIMSQLRWSLQALASPAEVQITVFPSFVCVADELALEFDNWFETATGNFGEEMTKDQKDSLAAIDARLTSMSRMGAEFSPELWEPESLSANSLWQEIRELAKTALIAFDWPVERPGPVSETYVTDGRMYQDGREWKT